MPDTREWIQWKGRTARQDKPGQFVVILSTKDTMFRKNTGLAGELARKNVIGEAKIANKNKLFFLLRKTGAKESNDEN